MHTDMVQYYKIISKSSDLKQQQIMMKIIIIKIWLSSNQNKIYSMA